MASPDITDKEVNAVATAVKSGWISGGSDLASFERELAAAHGCRFGVGCSSGGTALHLAIATLKIKPGNEVIIPGLTMIAVANSVLQCGATPVFADAADEFGNPDIHSIIPLITNQTKLVVLAHAYGQPATDICNIVEKIYPIPLLEDCAESHYACQAGKPVGSFGKLATFSFYANKVITTGEGGMVIGNDEAMEKHLRSLHNHGFGVERFRHTEMAFSYRMTEMQASLGLIQHRRHSKILQKRWTIRRWYEEELCERFAPITEGSTPWVFPVFTSDPASLQFKLRNNGIDSRRYFVPMNQQPFLKTSQTLPVATALYESYLCLPLHTALTRDNVQTIAEVVRSA